MYHSLNDAAIVSDIFSQGNMDVYYVRYPLSSSKAETLETLRDISFGSEFWEDGFIHRILNNIDETHVKIGSIKGSSDIESIFEMLQGEIWSPFGEACDLIETSRAMHTSMSVGDIIHDRDEDTWHICVSYGFMEIDGRDL